MTANLWLRETALSQEYGSHNLWNDYLAFCQCFEDMVLW